MLCKVVFLPGDLLACRVMFAKTPPFPGGQSVAQWCFLGNSIISVTSKSYYYACVLILLCGQKRTHLISVTRFLALLTYLGPL
jgi:hypothetical protein